MTVTTASAAAPLFAAVDIGGTKIAGALVDERGGLRHRLQLPTPAQESGEAVIAVVRQVLDRLAGSPDWAAVRAVGIGSAGPVDLARGAVSPVNIPGWRGFPLVAEVAAHTALAARGLKVHLAGDGVAMAAAEHWRGAARGADNALCLVVSTGVGAGLVLDGAVRPGPSGNAGHLGHITVDLDGEACPCGSRGCLEGIASGTAIARRALAEGWRPSGEDRSARAVAADAEAGDPIALTSFDRAAQALAAGIAATAALVDLDRVVIGGGVATAGDVLFAPLARHLDAYAVLPYVRRLDVRRAQLGTDAGLIGAAALCR
ncbi:ROK family protein [Streptomyces kaniharaensis]|uniref:ROK family protein n=1 Tax=Streptomyces kaniharaensis TaxID=212423 RepID=A0A6N7KHX8_9ACTN|nr:ROK family protein [Streptomyces kaniharaensis]MQS11092.1 ROK family protein [Streptomyces kaniharaensis]